MAIYFWGRTFPGCCFVRGAKCGRAPKSFFVPLHKNKICLRAAIGIPSGILVKVQISQRWKKILKLNTLISALPRTRFDPGRRTWNGSPIAYNGFSYSILGLHVYLLRLMWSLHDQEVPRQAEEEIRQWIYPREPKRAWAKCSTARF